MKQRQATLTTGPVGRTLLWMTVPMVFGHFSTVAFHLADTLFVAQLGAKELAALSFTFPVVQLIAGLAIGLGIGTGAVVSQAIGNRDQHLVRRLATHSLILSVLIAAALSAIGLMTIDPLFRLLGATGDILPMIRNYMGIWYIAAVFTVVPMVGNNSIRATGDTTFPSLIMMISAGLNVILDPLFIFGLGGFPRMGLQGAALATLIARVLGFLAALAILHFRDRLLDFTLPRLTALWDSWKRVLSIGAPAVATMVLLPHGLCYGRVTPETGERILAAHEQGLVLPEHLRGRCALSRLSQAAEALVREAGPGSDAISGLLPLSEVEVADDEYEVVLSASPDLVVRVRETAVPLGTPATCRAVNEDSVAPGWMIDATTPYFRPSIVS